jgi:hypothetical protein
VRVRSLIAPLAIVLAGFTVAATAEDGPAPAGRYELTSGPDSSFVRLDTRTGAVSHCRQDSGVWRCEPILDSGLSDRLTALSGKVDHLSSDVEHLSLRVDALSSRAALPAPDPGPDAKGHDRHGGVAQTVVQRLLDMIRTLKHGRADTTLIGAIARPAPMP